MALINIPSVPFIPGQFFQQFAEALVWSQTSLPEAHRKAISRGSRGLRGWQLVPLLHAWKLWPVPAQWLALARAGQLAHFRPGEVSPVKASKGLRTPIALLAGDSDQTTPLAGVLAIAQEHPDLTVVRGADHLEAGARLPGGWGVWARGRLEHFGF